MGIELKQLQFIRALNSQMKQFQGGIWENEEVPTDVCLYFDTESFEGFFWTSWLTDDCGNEKYSKKENSFDEQNVEGTKSQIENGSG